MFGSRYSSLVNLKYKQYYTINFLVCVSILFIVPEFGEFVRGNYSKNNNFGWRWDSVCEHTHEGVGTGATFGVFLNENDYQLYYHSDSHSYLCLVPICGTTFLVSICGTQVSILGTLVCVPLYET